jgi:hypothetical protein
MYNKPGCPARKQYFKRKEKNILKEEWKRK